MRATGSSSPTSPPSSRPHWRSSAPREPNEWLNSRSTNGERVLVDRGRDRRRHRRAGSGAAPARCCPPISCTARPAPAPPARPPSSPRSSASLGEILLGGAGASVEIDMAGDGALVTGCPARAGPARRRADRRYPPVRGLAGQGIGRVAAPGRRRASGPGRAVNGGSALDCARPVLDPPADRRVGDRPARLRRLRRRCG